MSTERQRRLLYLCFETLDPDRAAHAHVHGIVDPLRARGWHVDLVAGSGQRRAGLAAQLLRYIHLNLIALRHLPQADGFYIRAHFAAWPAAMAAKMMGRPVFHEVNGVPDDIAITYPAMGRVMGLLRWLYRSQYRAAAHIFAVTQGLADHARKLAGHGHVSVAPNGVDVTRFAARNVPRPAEAPQGRYVLFYGDVARWHGLDLMFDAARHETWPQDVSLLLIGRGSAAETLSVPDDLRGRVIWIDRRPQAELLPFIAHALAGLAPITDPGGRSSTGVLPLKLLEMLAAGLPVIVTDLPGQADLVREVRCGLVIAPQAQALAEAVAELASSPAREAMGARGAHIVRERYAWPVIAKDIEAEIIRLV